MTSSSSRPWVSGKQTANNTMAMSGPRPSRGSVDQRGPMHDGERRGRDRFRFERRVDLVKRSAEISLDGGTDLEERHGRTGVKAAAELMGHRLTEDAR